jgi:hypothetical protein
MNKEGDGENTKAAGMERGRGLLRKGLAWLIAQLAAGAAGQTASAHPEKLNCYLL